jgi:hypothetical protein
LLRKGEYVVLAIGVIFLGGGSLVTPLIPDGRKFG